MIVSRRMAVIPKDIHEVWKIVTSVEDAGWRSDLSRTEILNERQFVEYTKKGYPTIFTVTAEETDRLWEFDLENNTMQGHWRGVFLAKGKETELDFTEQIHCKKLILRPFIKLYLKSQQSRYVSDLKSIAITFLRGPAASFPREKKYGIINCNRSGAFFGKEIPAFALVPVPVVSGESGIRRTKKGFHLLKASVWLP